MLAAGAERGLEVSPCCAAQRGVGPGSVSAGGFVGNKGPPRGAAL